MAAVIEVRNVVKRYGAAAAIDDVSLTAPSGAIYAVVGENGAGKSTLIRLLLGLTQPDSGEIRVLGLDARTQADAIRRRVGYVSDQSPLYEWMTAAEIGWFTAGFYPPGFETSYREFLREYDVDPTCRISQMSKGTRAKVVLALAVAHDPELLILDEPTTGLDTLVRRQFLENIVSLAAEGRTIFLSTHHIGEVERVADLVTVMRSGRVLLTQELDELKQETRELTVTTRGNSAPPRIRGEVLRTRREARQWQVLVRAGADADVARLCSDPLIVAIDERTPSLEEIYIALMQTNELGAEAPQTQQAVDDEPLTFPRVTQFD